MELSSKWKFDESARISINKTYQFFLNIQYVVFETTQSVLDVHLLYAHFIFDVKEHICGFSRMLSCSYHKQYFSIFGVMLSSWTKSLFDSLTRFPIIYFLTYLTYLLQAYNELIKAFSERNKVLDHFPVCIQSANFLEC